MAESSSPAFLITRALGISTSLFLSGYAFSASQLSIPAISLSPLPLRLSQWSLIYTSGAKVSPPLAIFSLFTWGYASYLSYSHSHSPSISSSISLSGDGTSDWVLYVLAGGLSFSILPWTLIMMMPTNNELLRRAKVAKEREGKGEVKEEEDKESGKLIEKWDGLHFVRFWLPTLGAAVGLYAVLK